MSSRRGSPELAVALNTSSQEEALGWARQIGPALYKVGLPLYLRHGKDFVRRLSEEMESPVFLDLKLGDIPLTVAQASGAVADLKPRYFTVHAWAGPEAVRAAVEELPETRVLGVTVLTSISPGRLAELGFSSALDAVLKLAEWALKGGAWGVVASGLEAPEIKARFPQLGVVVPGVRLPEDSPGDQARIADPRSLKGIADCVVVGRPIVAARNPREAYRRYLRALQ